MGGTDKLHVGFPEKALEKFSKILVEHGLKVAVVEQTETPAMMERRVEQMKRNKQKVDKNDKVVNRVVCEVLTKGTFKGSEQNYEPRYVLAFRQEGRNTFGITFFDVNILKVYVGQIVDDE